MQAGAAQQRRNRLKARKRHQRQQASRSLHRDELTGARGRARTGSVPPSGQSINVGTHQAPQHALRSTHSKDQGDDSLPSKALSSASPGSTSSSHRIVAHFPTTRNATTPLAVQSRALLKGTDDHAIVASAQVSATGAIPVAGGPGRAGLSGDC